MSVRLPVATLIALVLGLLSWGNVTRDTPALAMTALVAAAVVFVGMVARWLRSPDWLLSLLQLAVLVGSQVLLVPGGPMDALEGLPDAYSDAFTTFATHQPPLNPHPSVTLVLALFVGLLAYAADLVACTLQRPAWAIVPLAVEFIVPAVVIRAPVEFVHVAAFGIGVALILLAGADVDALVGRRGFSARARAATGGAVLTAAALALTALVAPLVPIELSKVDHRTPIQMSDPSLDLKKNLVRGDDVPIIDYTTDGPGGVYLRLVSLPAFTDTGFHLTTAQVDTGRLPAAPGLSREVPQRTTRVSVGSFDSEWLPLPYAPVSTDAGGDWGHLRNGLEVLALAYEGRTHATRDLTYQVTSREVRPSDDEIAKAKAGRPADARLTAEVPTSMPASIKELAQVVTAEGTTDGEKALLIEDFLLSERFTYSLRPEPGTAMGSLERFLLTSREGYCEQFAGSMAAMARAVGIPSRIAVGFTPGAQRDDGSWQVTTHNMHAWPELYFEEWGWVAFEPTPSTGTGANRPSASPEPSASASEEATASPEPAASAEPSDAPSPEESPSAAPTDPEGPGAQGGLFDPRPWLAGLGVLLLLVVLAAAPRWWRERVRRGRLDPSLPPRDAALGAWAELRASAIDWGVDWPSGSPRYVAADLDAAGQGSFDDLAIAAEQALFAPADAPIPPVDAARLSAGVRAWSDAAKPLDRLRAVWLPRSLWTR